MPVADRILHAQEVVMDEGLEWDEREIEVADDDLPSWIDGWIEQEEYDPNWRKRRVVVIDPRIPAEYRGRTWTTQGFTFSYPPYRDDPQGSIIQPFSDFQEHAWQRTLGRHPDWFCGGMRDNERVHGPRWLGRGELEKADSDRGINGCFWCYPHLAPPKETTSKQAPQEAAPRSTVGQYTIDGTEVTPEATKRKKTKARERPITTYGDL